MTAVRPMDHHVVDPTGLGVILTEECWLDHITTRHPEMHPFKEMVLETTRAPDPIYVGKRDPSRRVYARKYAHVPGVGNELTLLVFAGNEDGYIATAHFAGHQLRSVGRQIWPSN